MNRKSVKLLTFSLVTTSLACLAQAQLPPTLDSGGAGRGRGSDGGCTTEERDESVDCGLRIRARKPEPVAPAQKRAPIDLTGHWVAVITEDWRWRMIVPPKGDFVSLPVNDEAVRVANTWDPKDVGSCKQFGAPALLRNPTRVRFTWEDENTLKLETDNGEQTRLFHFDAAPADAGAPSLQGYSAASWDMSGMKAVTTQLTPGYLRANGVPYSEKTRLTEYFNRYTAFDEDWLTVTTLVNDPTYLTREFTTSLDFKRLKDGAEWNPYPCGAAGVRTTGR